MTCPRWRAEAEALSRMSHVGKGELRRRHKVHIWTCPTCAGWVIPNLPRDPTPERTP